MTLNENVNNPVQFTTNVDISVNGTVLPAGSVIPVGTRISAGTVLPAGLAIPAGINLPAQTSYAPGFVKANPTGTSFGLAVTYDLKLDPQGRSTAYLGPKLAFSSASGPVSIGGVSSPGATINTSEAKIGLVAGLDYAISDGFTIGANATYNFSRTLIGSISANGQSTSVNDFIKPAGSAIDFGIRVGYQF